MLFDPHSHITEESNTHHHNQNNMQYPAQNFFNISAFTGQPDQQLNSNFNRVEEWMQTVTPMETVQSDFLGRHEVPNVRVSYDIYGNELPVEESPLLPVTTKHMELESIQEEELASPYGIPTNQENSDPVLGHITPLKRREFEPARIGQRRMSVALTLNRSPLLDITPVSRRRKCSYHVETTTEVNYSLITLI